MYNLYIGANNTTGKVELAKIKKITSKVFSGFSIIPAVGYWMGAEEKSIILQIETLETKKLQELAKVLKNELKQDAIAIQKLPGLKFV